MKKKANKITDEIDFSLKVRFFSRKPVEFLFTVTTKQAIMAFDWPTGRRMRDG